jgi:hypothetical protein
MSAFTRKGYHLQSLLHEVHNFVYFTPVILFVGYAAAHFVEALRYKPEDR